MLQPSIQLFFSFSDHRSIHSFRVTNTPVFLVFSVGGCNQGNYCSCCFPGANREFIMPSPSFSKLFCSLAFSMLALTKPCCWHWSTTAKTRRVHGRKPKAVAIQGEVLSKQSTSAGSNSQRLWQPASCGGYPEMAVCQMLWNRWVQV